MTKKIIVKNHDEEATDKLSVEELNARLKESITSPDDSEGPAESEIEQELKESLDEPADDEAWLEEFDGEEPEPGEKPKGSEPDTDDIEDRDKELDNAVEDIEKSDSDELLEKKDEELAKESESQKPKGLVGRVKHFFAAWWANKLARNLTFAGIGLAVLVIILVPGLRYFTLNAVGVRAVSSVTVVDQTTSQPIKNASVTIAGQTAKTGDNGRALLSELKLGPTELVIKKPAFADVNQSLTIGLGSNPLGEYKLKAVGAQYTLEVKDWLSAKPLEKVEASSGENSSLSDKDGKIILTVDNPDSETIDVQVSFSGYRTEKIKIKADDKSVQKLAMVPARKHLFVSNRDGNLDLYKIDADGQNEQILLAGTGKERSEDMALAPNYEGKIVALVTTREGVRNKDNYLMSGLYMVDIATGTLKKVTSSERIQLIQWIGNRLIYVAIADGASASNPKRHRLMTYNAQENTNKEIAATNYFNDVLVAADKVYFAPSNSYNQDPASARLFSVNADGSNKKTLLGQEVWNIFRTSYSKLAIATSSQWYGYKLGDESAIKLASPPAQQKSRLYVDNNDRSKALWYETRDGKETLLNYDIKNPKDDVLAALSGLSTPYYWLSNSYVIYRVNSDDEIADYVISTAGGEAKKIRDVANIGGIDRWYYY